MRLNGKSRAIMLPGAGPADLGWQPLAKCIALILLVLVVINHNWALVLGLVLIIALLAVGELLKEDAGGQSS